MRVRIELLGPVRAYADDGAPIEVGGVMVDDVPTYRIDHMPYGGVKESGTAREGLRYAIEEMTELKTVVFHGINGGGS